MSQPRASQHLEVTTLIDKNPSISGFDLYYLGFFSFFIPELSLQDIFQHIANIIRMHQDRLLTNEEKIEFMIRMLSKKVEPQLLHNLAPNSPDNDYETRKVLSDYFMKIMQLIPQYIDITKFELFYLGLFHGGHPSYPVREIFFHVNNVNLLLKEELIDKETHLQVILKILDKKSSFSKKNSTGLNIPDQFHEPILHNIYSITANLQPEKTTFLTSEPIQSNQNEEIVMDSDKEEKIFSQEVPFKENHSKADSPIIPESVDTRETNHKEMASDLQEVTPGLTEISKVSANQHGMSIEEEEPKVSELKPQATKKPTIETLSQDSGDLSYHSQSSLEKFKVGVSVNYIDPLSITKNLLSQEDNASLDLFDFSAKLKNFESIEEKFLKKKPTPSKATAPFILRPETPKIIKPTITPTKSNKTQEIIDDDDDSLSYNSEPREILKPPIFTHQNPDTQSILLPPESAPNTQAQLPLITPTFENLETMQPIQTPQQEIQKSTLEEIMQEIMPENLEQASQTKEKSLKSSSVIFEEKFDEPKVKIEDKSSSAKPSTNKDIPVKEEVDDAMSVFSNASVKFLSKSGSQNSNPSQSKPSLDKKSFKPKTQGEKSPKNITHYFSQKNKPVDPDIEFVSASMTQETYSNQKTIHSIEVKEEFSFIKEEDESNQERSNKNPKISILSKIDEETLSLELIKKLQAEEADQDFTPCFFCKTDLYAKTFRPLESCGHVFHEECLKIAIENNIEDKKLPLVCPLEDCGSKLILAEVLEILPEDKQEKFLIHYINAFIDADDSINSCPTHDCPYSFLHNHNKDQFKCPVCMKKYCLNCKCDWHTGKECSVEKSFEDSSMKKVRSCPSCKNWVEKPSNSKILSCKCTYRFCYTCGEKVTGSACPCNNEVKPMTQQELFEKIIPVAIRENVKAISNSQNAAELFGSQLSLSNYESRRPKFRKNEEKKKLNSKGMSTDRDRSRSLEKKK